MNIPGISGSGSVAGNFFYKKKAVYSGPESVSMK